MKNRKTASEKYNIVKWILGVVACCLVIGVFVQIYFYYTFPAVKCEAAIKHLDIPNSITDCYECHKKTTPKLAFDWYESKHGVMLVKCFVCHGQPDGKGSVPFNVKPDPKTVCRKCHDPSMQEMEKKYGIEPDCNKCHPFHNNSLHHAAYSKQKSKKSAD
jgi:hypothetical protein